MALTFWKSKYWTRCGVALGAFAAGLFTAGPIFHLNEVRADSNRAFELRIYHALPGKLPAMESRFRDTTSKLLVRHNLNVIGYWIPDSKSPALGQYIRLPSRSFKPRGSGEELARDGGRPRFSRDH